MKCTNCGNEIPDGASFCAQCGAKVHNEYVVQDEEQQNTGYNNGGYNNGGYNNGGYRQYTPGNETLGQSNGLAIGSMVTGICSLVLSCCSPLLSFILAIVSLVLGIYVLTKNRSGRGMAIAGIVCSGIGLFSALIFTIVGSLIYLTDFGYWY